jgi:hypothetical protein
MKRGLVVFSLILLIGLVGVVSAIMPLLGTVSEGEIITLVSESGTYVVSIEYIDSDNVKLFVNEEITDILIEGEVFNFVSERFSIEIIDIDYLLIAGAEGSVTFWIFEEALEEGDIKNIIFDGKGYNVSIDYIDSQNVKLNVNEESTPQLQEGESHLLSDGIKIGILNIVYSPIAGESNGVVLRIFNSSSLFDSVNVLYAARVIVDPVSMDTSDINNSWLVDIAGGENKPVEVLYGVVELVSGDYSLKQKFMGLGPVGSDKSTETFLSEYRSVRINPDNSPFLDISMTSFLSSKQINGTEIVRDYSGPIKAIRLFNDFSEDSMSLYDVSLSSHYFESYSVFQSNLGFCTYSSKPTENYWQADMDTLIETGDINFINRYDRYF